MDYSTIIDLLSTIVQQLEIISTFIQILSYGIVVLLIIYFGYWFFSRFFY